MFSSVRYPAAIFLAVVMIVMGFEYPCAQSSVRMSESSVIRLEVDEEYSRAVGRHLTVEVGDSTRAQFEPSFKLTGWDDQVEFRVNLATTRYSLRSAERQVTVRNDQPMTRLIGTTCDHELYVRADGNFEWNLILKEKPVDTVFRFGISLTGLTVHYQDKLSVKEIADGAVRPDSVVGSYAVYHVTGKGGVSYGHDYLSNYRCGKVFHIYRPLVWDVSGDTVWAAIAIDTTVDSLSLVLNGHWLANAVYPVTVDPTFGTTAMGASSQSVGISDVLHCRYTTSTSTGTLDSITWGLNRSGDQPNVGYAMYEKKPGYDACSLLVDTSTTQLAVPFRLVGTWYSLEMAENATLSANTDYWLSLGVEDASCSAWYDDTDADTTAGYQDDPWPFNNPCNTGWVVYTSNRTYSVYGTFTCDNCVVTGRRRREMLLREQD